MNKGVSHLLAVLMKELGGGGRDSVEHYPVPEGWFSIDDIREELRMAHTRNASTRAYDLFRRGMLERKAHSFKANTGQCNKAYVYRPLKPYLSIRDASNHVFDHQADKVPKGWVRIVDYCSNIRASHVSVRNRIARANLKPKYYKTPRGIIGLHLNAFYKKSEIDRLFGKR